MESLGLQVSRVQDSADRSGGRRRPPSEHATRIILILGAVAKESVQDAFHMAIKPLSPGTHRFLCDIASADINRNATLRNVKWDEALPALHRNGLFPLCEAYLGRQTEDAVPSNIRRSIRVACMITSMQMKVKLLKMRCILSALSDADVEYIVVKGVAVARTVYSNPSYRPYGDVDIVIRERDWKRAHTVLERCGFVASHGCGELVPKIIPEAIIQEIPYWNERDQLLLEVHFEDILYSGMAARDVDGFWNRSRVIDLDGLPVRVMCLEDQLVHLCAHLHFDGAKRLIWFTDIALIVRDHAHRLDWDRVLDIVRVEDAQVSVYYGLRWVSLLLDIELPDGILDAVRPDRFRRWWHERYLPEAKVLSLEPMAQPSLSFYFQPLFRRLIPDLLIMGRRKDKLRYLAHLLFPPAKWLRYYYHIDTTRSVLPHYLLHPIKLVGHYLRDSARAFVYLVQEKRGVRDWAWWSVGD